MKHLHIAFVALAVSMTALFSSCSTGSNMTDDATRVIRTDYSDDSLWNTACKAIGAKSTLGFTANVKFVDSKEFDGQSAADVVKLLGDDYQLDFVFIVDSETIAHSEMPVLVVDFLEDPPIEFRATPEQIQTIENNLSIANMDTTEFADAVDDDGIFRGF